MSVSGLTMALSEVMGAGHALKPALRAIWRWRRDPNFDPDYCVKSAEDLVSEYHKRLVIAANVVEKCEAALRLEIEARDEAITKLAEYYDDDGMDGEFHGLVEAIKEKRLAKKLADALLA